MSRFGKEYTFELKSKLMGLHARETAEEIVSALELPMTPQEFMDRAMEQFEHLFPDTEVLPGKLSFNVICVCLITIAYQSFT